ncbi:MAG: phosphoadenosine phosphosulfate reductase family protein [Collimonas sp.]|uniref:phosphoadenosine phosphosulfate reductase family protein n=1 Tax=Collimonas sp. TaxID=1963772 RepID=UPI003267AD44
MSIKHIVSLSGGKDSAATLALAIERFGVENVEAITCDTDNEHDFTYTYIDYLAAVTGVKITVLKANFDMEIARKRKFVANDQRTRREYKTEPVFDADGKPVPQRDGFGNVVLNKKGTPVQKTRKIGGGHRVRWSNKAKRRALAVLYPTGNSFLDLCIWKGKFPSRKSQFCTEHLKRNLAVEYQLDLVDQGYTVVSWQGVRRDESENRKNALKFEVIGPRLYAYRPLVDWTAPDVFAYCQKRGIKPNPLYLEGMSRVGCMPCINAKKEEIRQIASRFIEHMGKVHNWEKLVGLASKRGASTFFPAPGETRTAVERGNIWQVIEWSRTTRGGKQFSLLEQLDEPTACSSSYGLCG